MSIKTAILTDWKAVGNYTPEREAEEIVAEFLEHGGIELDVLMHTTSLMELTEIADRVDLLVIDYGGVGEAYGGSDHYAFWIRGWAENHPSGMVVLWTEFTTRYYRYTLEDAGFTDLPNVVLRAQHNPLEEYSVEVEKIFMLVRIWFGIKASERILQKLVAIEPPSRKKIR